MRFCLCLLGEVSPCQYCKVDPGCSQTAGPYISLYPLTILDDILQQERMESIGLIGRDQEHREECSLQ